MARTVDASHLPSLVQLFRESATFMPKSCSASQHVPICRPGAPCCLCSSLLPVTCRLCDDRDDRALRVHDCPPP